MTEEHRSDGRSIDEILAEARAELDKTPDGPQQAAEPGTPEPDDFTPDFGHTFDDYGEFEEPQPEEELPPEPPRKRHKRIVPLFVKNDFFGGNVDVTGLLCGCDMADAVRAERERGLRLALIPRVVFNDNAVTLDDMSLEDMEKRAGAPLAVVSCNASDYLLEIIDLVGRNAPTP